MIGILVQVALQLVSLLLVELELVFWPLVVPEVISLLLAVLVFLLELFYMVLVYLYQRVQKFWARTIFCTFLLLLCCSIAFYVLTFWLWTLKEHL